MQPQLGSISARAKTPRSAAGRMKGGSRKNRIWPRSKHFAIGARACGPFSARRAGPSHPASCNLRLCSSECPSWLACIWISRAAVQTPRLPRSRTTHGVGPFPREDAKAFGGARHLWQRLCLEEEARLRGPPPEKSTPSRSCFAQDGRLHLGALEIGGSRLRRPL